MNWINIVIIVVVGSARTDYLSTDVVCVKFHAIDIFMFYIV